MIRITLTLLLLGLFISLNAQEENDKNLVIIRVIESRMGYTGGFTPVIHITENDGSYRTIELEKHFKDYLIKSTSNQKKIHKELKKYLNEGYEIIGHTKGIESIAIWFEDYILVK